MNAENVIARFQEWQLSAALAKLVKDPAALWNLSVVRPVPDGTGSCSLATLFQTPNLPTIAYEAPFLKVNAKCYGFTDEQYWQKNFWGLRPDFTVEGPYLLVLLEAKGSSVPPKTWSDPKERVYYRFLSECSSSATGFYYIVPRPAEHDCAAALLEHFQSASKTRVGYMLWEDLLPLLHLVLLEGAVDELVRLSDGLRRLRDWQKETASCHS
jgi:hypothetical protein